MDPELLSKCRLGDPGAIETLVSDHQARVYRFCLSILEDPEDAQDAVQESFMAAFKSLSTYRGDSAFNTWLFSIVLNTCRGQLRQRKRRVNLQHRLTDPASPQEQFKKSPENRLLEGERTNAIRSAINRLDEKHRLPIIMRYFHELSTQEIAEVMGINVGTVHSRLSNGRNRLAGELKRANLSFPGGEL
ncbi:MAG: RNA polymerase sigma factor [Anaerolineales bacterium]